MNDHDSFDDLISGFHSNEKSEAKPDVTESKPERRNKKGKKNQNVEKQKTSLYLPVDLFWRLKQHCVLERINMTKFMEDAVCEKIKREERKRSQDANES